VTCWRLLVTEILSILLLVRGLVPSKQVLLMAHIAVRKLARSWSLRGTHLLAHLKQLLRDVNTLCLQLLFGHLKLILRDLEMVRRPEQVLEVHLRL
jgi:hypothetical protein